MEKRSISNSSAGANEHNNNIVAPLILYLRNRIFNTCVVQTMYKMRSLVKCLSII